MRATSYAAGTGAEPLLRRDDRCESRRAPSVRSPTGTRLIVPFQDVRYTYRRIRRRSGPRGACAARVGPGDRATGSGIWSPNCAEWVVLQYATAKVGVILVNINPAYRAYELAYVARAIRVAAMLVRRDRVQGERLPRDGRRGRARTSPQLERVVYPRYTDDWEHFVGAAPTRSMPTPSTGARPSSAFDDPINIQYTSGTTGFPKGATLSHHNILNNGYFVGEGCGYTEADRVCIPVPLYHCFGMVLGNLACTTHGAAMVLPAPGFEPRRHARGGRRGTVHEPVRRADDVHRRARARRLRRRSTCRRCGPGSWPARRARSR